MERTSGILLHPTSLPGPSPAGDLGPAALDFLDWLAFAGAGLWQVLPLGPTGWGDSPYTSTSVFAGSATLISPEALAGEGWLASDDLEEAPASDPGRSDFAAAHAWKEQALRLARQRLDRAPAAGREAWERFRDDAGIADWLETWARYAALKDRFGGRAWTAWPAELRDREPGALAAADRELGDEIEHHRFVQFLFERQWDRVRNAAHARGIRLVGDLPIYPALDSADVWAAADLFDLTDDGRPRAVAGVPPDYFSDTGQRWGNPLYRWDRVAADGYGWWVRRVRQALGRFDWLRIDHFRGLVAYWEVPADAETAASGTWRAGPGRALFDALESALGGLPLVAEDLGLITPDVEALRRDLDLPGMKVLQFAFDEPGSDHLPHRLGPRTVVYTATHDNDTARGWFRSAPPETRRRALAYLGGEPDSIHWSLVRAAWTSPACWAIAPLQDVLGLGPEARLNHPGRAEGNWTWRVRREQIEPAAAERLAALTEAAERGASAPEAAAPGDR